MDNPAKRLKKNIMTQVLQRGIAQLSTKPSAQLQSGVWFLRSTP